MIGYFEDFYSGELLSSVICRTFSNSGYLCNRAFRDEIFRNKKESINYLFFNTYSNDFINVLKGTCSTNFLLSHTLIPYYLITIDNDKKKRVQRLFKLFDRKTLASLPIPKNINNKLRYCPICYEEDLKENKQPYFRVSHQVVDYCHSHNCRLLDSGVCSHQHTTCNFRVVPKDLSIDNRHIVSDSDINARYTKYVNEILGIQVRLARCSIKEFLRNHLPDKYFIGKTCERVNSAKLHNDLNDFLRGLDNYRVTKYRVRSLLNGTQLNIKDYLMLCLFLEIKPIDVVVRPRKEDRTLKKQKAILVLYEKLRSINGVSNQLNIDKRIVRRIVKKGI